MASAARASIGRRISRGSSRRISERGALDGVGVDWPYSYARSRALLRSQRCDDGRVRARRRSGLSAEACTASCRHCRSGAQANGRRRPSTPWAGIGGQSMRRSIRRPMAGDRPCNNCGPCLLGCVRGAKASCDVTYLAGCDGQWRRSSEHAATCYACTIENGRATGVTYADETGIMHEQPAALRRGCREWHRHAAASACLGARARRPKACWDAI